jgi:mono/diheme cytochrome c family protein
MAMLTLGMLPVKPIPDTVAPAGVAKGPTEEYERYVAGFIDCAICHGESLTGGTSPIAPKGPSLAVVGFWTVDQFKTTMRTGVSPTRGPLDPDKMPWKNIGLLDDVELTALYEFVKTVR